MKKEGIQTRNRKLSSKSKKKKGMGGGCLPIGSHLGMSDLMKPLDPSKAFSSGFSASMGESSLYQTIYSTIFFCAIWFSVNHRWLSSMLKNINGQQQIYINKWHFLLIFFWHVIQFRSTWPSIQFIASGTCAYAWWLVCQRYGCIGRFKRSAGRFRLKRFGWRCCATFTVLSPNGKSQNLCVFFQVIKIVLHIRPMFSMLFFFESLFAFRRFAHYTIIHFSTYTLSM